MKTKNLNNPENAGKPEPEVGGKNNELHEILAYKEWRERTRKRNSALFLNIGFCMSILLVLSAFELNFYDGSGPLDLSNDENIFEALPDIPNIVMPEPPAPKISMPEIREVIDEVEVINETFILDNAFTEDLSIGPVPVIDIPPISDEPADVIHIKSEEDPEPYGGLSSFYQYIKNNLKYPKVARQLHIQGRVTLRFVVEKDGSLTDIQVVKGIGSGCDEEAIRVISSAPKWKPGKQRGRPVRVYMSIPIVFRLER
ncbi:MAG TPA: TonB family protein [Cyclobacteriaceae bacterium]|nr:TonB family protein [Cyclobacteriaceae bacterium]